MLTRMSFFTSWFRKPQAGELDDLSKDDPRMELELELVAQLHRFYVYRQAKHSNQVHERLNIVDFSGVSQHALQLRGKPRSSTHEVDSNAPYAMNSYQPLLAYIDEGRLYIKDIIRDITTLLPLKTESSSVCFIVWISNHVLELFDTEGTAHSYDCSKWPTKPVAVGSMNGYSLPNPDQLLVTSASLDGLHFLLQNRPNSDTLSGGTPQLYHLNVSSPTRILLPVNTYASSPTYATLLSTPSGTFLTHTIEDGSDYKVRLFSLSSSPNHSIIESRKTVRPVSSLGEHLQFRSLEAFGSSGLIIVHFESETHIFAVNWRNNSIHRIFPPSRECDFTDEQDITQSIVDDCSRLEFGGKLSKEKLLWCLIGPVAAGFSEFLQSVLDSVNDNHSIRTHVLSLLHDICTNSDRLPSSYWLQGDVKMGRYVESTGDIILSRGTLTKDGVSQKVIIRQPTLPTERNSPQGNAMMKVLCREIVTHRQLVHPNIVKLLGVWEDEHHPMYSILPHLNNNLATKLDQGLLSSWDISLDVIRGIVYLHSRNPPVIHGDLHPGNILVGSEGQAVLCNFGLSRVRHQIERSQTTIQSNLVQRYVAPELLDQTPESKQPRTDDTSDVYSLAMTLFHLHARHPPFLEHEDYEAAKEAKAGRRPPRPSHVFELSDNHLWVLFEEMWSQKPKARPSASKILERFSVLRDGS